MANIFSQLVTLIIALISVPVYLVVWDISVYGKWLLIFSLPAYLLAADFGIGSASTNRLVMSQYKSVKEINIIFQTSFTLISIIAICMIVLVSVIALAFHKLTNYNLEYIVAGYILGILTIVNLYNPCIDGALRVHGLYAESTIILNCIRLLEWFGGVVALYLIPSFVSVALGMLIFRISANFLVAYLISKKLSYPRWGISEFSRVEFRNIAKPAFAFSLFPLANAISLQGMVVTVGYLLGPAAVVTFTCYRTISRIVTQSLAVVNRSYWPEFSELYASEENDKLKELFLRCKRLNLIIGVSAAVISSLLGEWILDKWTHGAVKFYAVYYYLMMAGVVVTAFWQAGWVLLMSTNRHAIIARWFLVVSVCSTTISVPLMYMFDNAGSALALLVFELLTTILITFGINNLKKKLEI